MKPIVLVFTVAAVLALLPGTAVAQTSTSQPVDPPPQVAQLRQQFEGLTLEQARAAGYEPASPCVPNPKGTGAMGIHALNQELFKAQFPSGTMDPANPSVLLLDQNNRVVGVEWEAKDVGQGPMQLFGQTIQIQPGHHGAEDPHYMLHIYFMPNDKVIFGTNDETAYNPELNCPQMPATGGMVSPAQVGSILFALAGGFAVLGVAFIVRQRAS